MTTITGLIAAAIVLVFFEVILPGGVLGILAGICVILATWLGVNEYGAMGGLGVFLGTSLAIVFVIFIEFKLLARTKFGNGFLLKNTVTGRSKSSSIDDTIIGTEGGALTRLNPSGKVIIAGQSYDAHSQDGYIDRGEPIAVVSKDNFKLIIKKL